MAVVLSVMLKHFKQLLCFGLVGGLSTLVSCSLFIFLVNELKILPLISNVLAFGVAFWVSYLGHSWWTFAHRQHDKQKITKFFLVSLMGLGLNSLFIWVLMHLLHQSAYVAITPMIFVTPLIIFFINKYWVFKQKFYA